MQISSFEFRAVKISLLGLLFAAQAVAVDGVIEINQASAVAGGITSGDAAGFPVTLDAPGSYRLTSNLTPAGSDTNVIEIDSVGVNLDLNGFVILGGTTCSASLIRPNVTGCTLAGAAVHGIAGNSIGSVEIRNGSIFGMKGALIELSGTPNVQIRDVIGGASGDPTGCIRLGVAAEVINTRVGFCNGGGLILADSAMVRDSRSGVTNDIGIKVGLVSIVRNNNVSLHNKAGISCLINCVIDGNTVSSNGTEGISAGTSSLTGNVSVSNGTFGMSLSSGGYGENVFNGNVSGHVSGSGVSRGDNSCSGAAC